MPLRVKCRCGQELVLRYSEWVYLLLGLAFLALILNSIVLVLLYVRLDDVASGTPRRHRDNNKVALERGGDSRNPRGSLEQRVAPGIPEPAEEKPQRDPRQMSLLPDSSPLPEAGEEPSPAGDPRNPLEEVRLQRHSAVLEKTVLEKTVTEKSGELSVAPVHSTSAVQGETERLSLGESPWFQRSALLRLLVLERAEIGDTLCLGFLLDPDLRIRKRAVERLLAQPPGAFIERDDAGLLIREAASVLKSSEDGRRLLRLLPAPAPAASDSRPETDSRLAGGNGRVGPVLESLRERAGAKIAGEPSRALERYLEKAEQIGVDVVLVVDVSRSMKGALEALQHEALWLLPMLSWAVPEVRVGVVLYRDGVEATADLSAAPVGEPLRLLWRSKAEGGGDVPEGVHEALKVALSLGAMSWRETALKEIVLIGDAPPPFAELESLTMLLRQAFQQGEYRLHAVSVGVEEGRSEVPFFPRLAKAGGGRALTVENSEVLGSEVLFLLFPEETHTLLRVLAPRMKESVSSQGPPTATPNTSQTHPIIENLLHR